MEIHQLYTHGPLRNFSYLIETSDGGAYVLDPFYANQIQEVLQQKGLELWAIINTHEHFDHVQGNEELVKSTGAEVWAHKNAKGKISGVHRFLNKGEEIEVENGWSLRVLDTPGHTFAHLCLVLSNQEGPHAVFTGDTLFNAGVGNCHNGGDPEVLYETVSGQLAELPGNVLVYPGHEYMGNNLGFTLDREPENSDAKNLLEVYRQMNNEKDFLVTDLNQEKKINTFLRLNSQHVRKHLPAGKAPDEYTEKEVFLSLRELRNYW